MSVKASAGSSGWRPRSQSAYTAETASVQMRPQRWTVGPVLSNGSAAAICARAGSSYTLASLSSAVRNRSLNKATACSLSA